MRGDNTTGVLVALASVETVVSTSGTSEAAGWLLVGVLGSVAVAVVLSAVGVDTSGARQQGWESR